MGDVVKASVTVLRKGAVLDNGSVVSGLRISSQGDCVVVFEDGRLLNASVNDIVMVRKGSPVRVRDESGFWKDGVA